MRDVMVRRGPDGEGHYIEGPVGMAMRRLSIIDLEGGWQPFFSRQDQIVAFQNGEIYNYRELRRELEDLGCHFVSQSDTEVLAHGYAEWGPDDLLSRLDGMYAIAILDRASRQLHLARDRFGEKPLFYTQGKGRFAYSSNLLSLAALDWVNDEIDAESMNRYLALHYVPGESTIFKSIKRVLPGERLAVPIDDPDPRRNRYYTMTLGGSRKIADAELAEVIERAVVSRLVADVPVGVFLSGGLDSSLIAAIAAKEQPHISTFSMGFDSASHDESRYAETVAKKIGSSHHHFVFDDESFRSLLPLVASVLDEPVGDQAQLPLYWLCEEARRHVTVALSGEGADEIFAGYGYYRPYAVTSNWRSKLSGSLLGRAQPPKAVARRLVQNEEPVTPSGFPLLTDISGRRRLTGISGAEIDRWEEGLLAWLGGASDSLQRAAAADLATWLPDDLLVKFDRISMAHSLEGRAPYLAPAVVEMGLSLPAVQKINNEVNKAALRRVATRWLPREILERPKQGFVLPMGKWLAQWFQGQPVLDYFLERAVSGLDMKEVAGVTAEDLLQGVKRERLLFALVLLVEWHQSFKSRQSDLRRKYKEAFATPGRADQSARIQVS
jgi:asparagine synthase (glutamine-hydrolysing)